MARGKTVIVSDIHMSDGESYSWFNGQYSVDMEQMFYKIAEDGAVEELVLLGDAFDTWLYPLNIKPFNFEQIYSKWESTVIKALKQCVKNIDKVFFINGNHDMFVTQDDLKKISSRSKYVELITAADYNKNKSFHLEHGNHVDMFNAPDNSGDTIGNYPLGFFITRMVCGVKDSDNIVSKIIELISNLSKNYLTSKTDISMGRFLVNSIITCLELYTGITDDTPIHFAEPELDKEGITVGSIRNKYWSLYDVWLKKYPAHILNTMLAGLIPRGLDWYASKLISEKSSQKVILGHTHLAVNEPIRDSAMGDYYNTGCWCSMGKNKKNPSYVVIDNNEISLHYWEE